MLSFGFFFFVFYLTSLDEDNIFSVERFLLKKVTLMPAYLPVVVHVAELVGEPLHVIWLESTGVIHDIVVGW